MGSALATRFRLSQNSITTKFNILFGCLILLFAAFLLFNQAATRRYSDSYESSISMYMNLVNMKSDIASADESIAEYLQTGNRAYLSEHNDAVRRVELALRGLRGGRQDPETASFLRSIADSFYSYQTAWNYAAFHYAQDNPYQSYLYSAEAESIGRYLQRYCDELLQQSIASDRESFEAMNAVRSLSLALNLVVLVVLVLVFFGSMVYFYFNLTVPLNELHRAALRIGDGEQLVSVEESYSEKTIAVLSRAFNTMSGNITRMVQGLREKAQLESRLLTEQLKNAEYESLLEQANFLALQSQTNPHFLFNTLSSISRTITLGDPADAVMMIDAMATLLRYSLSDSDQPVLLEEELRVVREYLHIQQFRFKERVQADMKMDETLAGQVLLPRLTLQPLVENAVIHGLEPKPEGGTIRITVERRKNLCVVTVSDDGAGMSAYRREEILEAGARGSPARSIGVHNTKRRLELFTRLPRCMTINSEPGRGTTVQVYLPIRQREVRDV